MKSRRKDDDEEPVFVEPISDRERKRERRARRKERDEQRRLQRQTSYQGCILAVLIVGLVLFALSGVSVWLYLDYQAALRRVQGF